MCNNINYQELKHMIQENDNPTLEPLRNLFAFMDYIDAEYQKDNEDFEDAFSYVEGDCYP